MIRHWTGLRVVLIVAALALLTGKLAANPSTEPSSIACKERYYVLLFGGKAKWWRPNTAHTWATFVRSLDTPTGPVIRETVTISWLPVTLHVRPWAVRTEPGANLPLHDTLKLMCRGTGSISLWGPFEIPAERYCLASAYKQVLDSGAVRYRVVDGAMLGVSANHCVRAVTIGDPDLFAASRPQLWIGEPITRLVAKGMLKSGMIVDPSITHDWLIPTLGIDTYPLARRQFGDPLTEFLIGR